VCVTPDEKIHVRLSSPVAEVVAVLAVVAGPSGRGDPRKRGDLGDLGDLGTLTHPHTDPDMGRVERPAFAVAGVCVLRY
jgi:hypothetical protein